MARPSMPEYLQYLGMGPRTMGWGALLIYDRFKANQLLAQEYIEHSSSFNDFPPFTALEATDQNSTTAMNNFRFSAPLLSFTNSNISSSRARLTMKIIEGQYLTLNKSLGGNDFQVTSIAAIDALNSPSLIMDIFLQATDNGSIVDEEGQVLLDLSDGENHTFRLSSSADRNRVLGIAIKKRFDSWSDDKKRFVLSRIAKGNNSLQPTSFAIRTHSLANAGQLNRTVEDNDEGSIIIGVAMNGNANGNFPVRDGDLPYLLPQAGMQTYSMNMLLRHDIWFDLITEANLAYLDKLPNVEYIIKKTPAGFVSEIVLITATGNSPGISFTANPPIVRYRWLEPGKHEKHLLSRFYVNQLNIDFSDIKYKVANGKISISWQGQYPITAYTTDQTEWNGNIYEEPSYLTLRVNVQREFSPFIDSGIVEFKETLYTQDFYLSGNWHFAVYDYHAPIEEWVNNAYAYIFKTYSNLAAGTGRQIDALFLNNLLFRNQMAAVPHRAEAPGDLSLLGDLAPEKLRFAIQPAITTVSAGASLPFILEGSATTVDWFVELALGETGDKGAINISTGLYRAPAASTVPATGRRVRVIAKQKGGGHVAQALVYISQNAVSVYPSLQVAQHSHARYLLVAGSGDGKPVNWNVTPDTQGSVRAPTSQDRFDMDIPDDQDVQIYVSPMPNQGPVGHWTEALQLDQVLVSSGAGNPRTVDLLIPWANSSSWFETEHQNGSVRLRMWTQGRGGPIEIPPEDADWFVIKGHGVLADGLYTPGAADQDYVIITAIENPSRNLNFAFVVLPLPLMDMKTLEVIDPAPQAGPAAAAVEPLASATTSVPATGHRSRNEWQHWIRFDDMPSDKGQQLHQLTLVIPPVARFETQEVHGAVQLSMYAQGRRGLLHIRPDEADWYVVKGDGVIKDGLYTPGPKDQNYAIVTAVEKNRRHLIHAFAVLPFSQYDPTTLQVLDAPSKVP